MFPSRASSKRYLEGLLFSSSAEPQAIYLHVPFCAKICGFCNLTRSVAGKELAGYHTQLIAQIKKAAAWPYFQGRPTAAVYFGGGTPTIFSADQLKEVLSALRDHFPLTDETEVSLETSISELTDEKLAVMKDLGVNRLSIGVQSFQDRARRLLGRNGSGGRAAQRTGEIAAAFKNTGIDLIYNYPDQSEEELEADLEAAFSLDIAGASVYALILMNGSSLDRRIRGGEVHAPAGLDTEKVFFQKILTAFRARGFEALEPTKFVRPGRDRYEYVRMQNSWKDVLALGTGAGGRAGDYVYYYAPVPMPPWEFPVSRMGRVASREQVFLEKISGAHQFGRFTAGDAESLRERYAEALGGLEAKGLLARRENEYRYTDEGLFWANTMSRYIVEDLAAAMGGAMAGDTARPLPSRASRWARPILAALGLVCSGLGFAGIALPLLPATPFFLAALFFFARSSRRFHAWLMGKRFIAKPLEDFRRQGGLTAGRKLRILASVFGIMAVSAFLVGKPHVWLILGAVFAVKLFLFVFVIKTVKKAP
jgi:oxygen-independent coproporphyrinogen-3 oxidase